ncbi:ATP-grasp domain-containing protein [Candidatus Kaiserbacteria bacterium]|nr:ATP-grasp domain-containing protein [Candidatus Kaiserbacteria bacterium]
MSRTIVGVLRGGPSSEYEHSLKSGAAILNALPEDRYDARDIFIDKTGLWHMRGQPADPARILSQIDVVWNALHGGVGEDGTVQRLLERSGVPYAGSRALASSISLNKIRSRELLRAAGILMPRAASFTLQNDITTADMARAVFDQFGPPYVVKPASEGSGFGIIIADSIVDLPDAIGDILDAYGAVLVEELIRGQEATAGVIEDFRDESLYVLPPAHIHASRAGFAVPSPFSFSDKERIAQVARAAHTVLGMSHFSNADFVLTKRGPYLLEVNAIPHLHAEGALHHMLESVGSSIREFAEHAIHLARKS